ncbi:MAG: tRNA (adenosine(37)-N6)-threonylcarbamoyltransferase complex dimerization subunit type 1 TsaB [Alphaproteobacteria bacterium]
MTASRGSPPTLLALDAATATCSVAAWAGGRVVAALAERPGRRHAERLVPMIEAVLAEAGLGYDALDALAVTVGPGSFTGVRIGLACARGLALASAKPLIGVTTLEALAHGAGAGRAVAAVIWSGRDRVFLQCFDPGGRARGEPRAATLIEAAASVALTDLLIGDAAAALAALTGGAFDPAAFGPDAAAVAELAARRLAGGLEPTARMPVPLYLRPPDARPMAARAR